jgi:hypothetical protein
MDDQTAHKSAVNGLPTRRIAALKRAFQRELGHKATCLQQTLIDRACVLTARSELATTDPTCTANDIVRLDNAAHKARTAAFEAIAAARKDDDDASPSYSEIMRMAEHAS